MEWATASNQHRWKIANYLEILNPFLRNLLLDPA